MRGVMAQLTFYNLKKKHKDSEHMVLLYVNSYETIQCWALTAFHVKMMLLVELIDRCYHFAARKSTRPSAEVSDVSFVT